MLPTNINTVEKVIFYTPETKLQSKQWTAKAEFALKKTKVSSARKVMATVLWDSHGVILIDYLQKGKTITGAYCAALLDKLVVGIAGKRPHLQEQTIMFHQDFLHLSSCQCKNPRITV